MAENNIYSQKFQWLTTNGEIAALIRKRDWSQCSIGNPDEWPLSLKTIINICLEANHPMFIWWGPDLLNFYNDSYCDLMQPTEHPKFFGEPAFLMWSENWQILHPFVEKVFRGESAVCEDMSVLVQHGEMAVESFYTFTYCPARDELGNINGIFCSPQNTTAQVTARNELKIISESIPQLVWSANAEGAMIYCNARWSEYSGNQICEWDQNIHPDDSERVLKRWSKSLISGEDFEVELRLRRRDGIFRTFLAKAIPLKEKNMVRKWYGTFTDIEDQKLAVMQLERERILREQFVSMLTHDLRSPLSAAKISAQMISRSNISPEKQNNLSVKIVDNINRINTMIENLLDANRVKAGERLPLKMGDVDLVHLVQDALSDLATVNGDRFKFESNQKRIIGQWSYDGLLRIIENLCNNAVKFGRAHAPITVSLDHHGNEVSLSVHNFGNPIPLEDQKKLFDPFKRTDNMDKFAVVGWGLGLTLVKGLTEAHGGRVTVTSNEAEGTTFTVFLPRDSRNIQTSLI